MIDVVGLTKRFREREIFSNLELRVAEGERVVVLGPSGAGKTTLLRCLVGLDGFEGGRVRAFGAEYTGSPTEAQALSVLRARLGFVFQRFHLFGHMSARDNVASGPRWVDGVSAGEANDRASVLLERLGLAHRADARPRFLSGGEEQRVAIARALARRPKALLLDEPTSALDPDKRGELALLLAGLSASDGVAMVIVTHDLDFARTVATRVVTLEAGRLRNVPLAG